jgi:hypothetical protein
LGPVDLECTPWPLGWQDENDITDGIDPLRFTKARIDWVVVGGESGPHARPMHPEWVRSLRDQCVAAGVPFFFKQWGEWAPICELSSAYHDSLYRPNRTAKEHEDQGALNELYGETCTVPTGILGIAGDVMGAAVPDAFHINRKPMQIFRAGKRAAGRLLDGRTWDEYPEVKP